MSSEYNYRVFVLLSVFLVFGIFACTDQGKGYETKNLQVIYETLPDSSRFHLNAGSSLELNVFSKTSRGVSLSGEAFFELEKGDIFSVTNDFSKIETNYGNFNVYNRNGILIIGSKTAVLNVIHDNRKSALIINPNEIVRVEKDGTIQVAKDQSSAVGSWITGMTKLRLVKLHEIIAELERKFDVEIEPIRLDLNRQTACNFQHEDINLALRTATGLLNLSYTFEGEKNIRLFED